MSRLHPERDLLQALPLERRIELDENLVRKPYTQSEIGRIQQEVAGRVWDWLAQNQKQLGDYGFDKMSGFLGTLFHESSPTVERRFAILRAAAEDPSRFGHLVEVMDRENSVHAAWRLYQELRGPKREPVRESLTFSLPREQAAEVRDGLLRLGKTPTEGLLELLRRAREAGWL